MAEPIAALIVRILADTSEMVAGVKNVSGQLDTLESRVGKFGKAIAGYFTAEKIFDFASQIVEEASQIDAASKRIGAGAEEFQRFAFGVKQAGIDAGAAEQNIAVLNARLGANDSGLLNVLRKLNISADEFRAKDPVQRYVDLGVAISKIADPAEQAAARVEALGLKGEKALAAIDAKFQESAKNAPIYSKEEIESLDSVGRALDRLEAKAKTTAASVAIAFAKALTRPDSSPIGNGATGGGRFSDAKVGGYDPRYDLGDGPMQPPNIPGSPLRAPDQLPVLGGIDPNDVKALDVAYANLAIELTRVQAEQREANEQFDATNAVLKLLRMELGDVAGAMEPFLKAFDTSSKVENMTRRIVDLAMQLAVLREEEDKLREQLNPGSTNVAGDDVDAKLFKLRSDSRNWGADGNLTPQALALESQWINNFTLQQAVNGLKPVSTPGAPQFGNNTPGFASVLNPGGSITINAQGALLNSPDSVNQLARLVEDAIARRSGFANTYTRR